MTEFNDEYFLNLTMKYDERNDEIYPKWAVWCAKSDDKYYIDGKDGHFYTHVRTDKEIAIEKKKREILDMRSAIDIRLDENGHPTGDWMEYERYLHELIMDEEKILDIVPMKFDEWKKSKGE